MDGMSDVELVRHGLVLLVEEQQRFESVVVVK